MKIISNIIFVVLVGVVIFMALFSSDNKSEFYVIQTNTDEEVSTLNYYEDNKFVGEMSLNIGFVGESYQNEEVYLYSQYSDKLYEYANGIENIYTINSKPVYYNEISGINYILHNDSFNSSKLIVYDKDFNKLGEEIPLVGFPINFTVIEETIYILTNVYDENYNKNAHIYKYSISGETIEEDWEIEEIVFGFYISSINETIKIYGHTSEEEKTLSVYEYDTTNKTSKQTNYTEVVMWVSKVLYINNSEYILSENLILKLSNDNLEKVIRATYYFIDFDYNSKEEYIYILSGDYIEKEYVVQIVDLEFSFIEEISILTENEIPIKIIIPSNNLDSIIN